MQNRYRWTFLLTLVVASLVVAPLAVQADLDTRSNALQSFGVKQDGGGEGRGRSGASPSVRPANFGRNFAAVVPSIGLDRRSPAVGSDFIATPGGFIRLSTLESAPQAFRAALDTEAITPTDVFVIHYGDSSLQEVHQSLQGVDVTLLGQIPNSAVVATGAEPYELAALTRSGFNILSWAPGLFISPTIGQTPVRTLDRATRTRLDMRASFFPGTDSGAVISALEGIGATVEGTFNHVIAFNIEIDDLRNGVPSLAGLNLRAMEEAGEVMSADEDTTQGTMLGEFRSGVRPYHDAGVDGGGGSTGVVQVIGISDTGLSLDAAVLADGGVGSATVAAGTGHRKVVAYVEADLVPGNVGGVGDLLSCDGTTGLTHGHLVGSIAAGNASDVIPDIRVLSGFETALAGTATVNGIDGVASGSRIYFIDSQDSTTGCGDPDQDEAQTPGVYSSHLAAAAAFDGTALGGDTGNVQVHNLSVSIDPDNLQASYDTTSQDIDDWLNSNQDHLVVTAAGNQGGDALADGNLDFGSVTPPCTAKSVVCVGTAGMPDNALDPEASVIPNVQNRGVEMLDRFGGGRSSGQGPAAFTVNTAGTADWRIKPDVMAPGGETLGAANQRMGSPTTCVSGDDDNTGAVECSRQLPGSFSGSSFASAAVAGVGAQIADYFQQGFHPNGQPGSSAADSLTGPELKSALIASADLMTGNPAWRQLGGQLQLGFYNPRHLNPHTPEQGYGRVQVSRLLPLDSVPESPSFIFSESVSVAATSSAARSFTVVDPGQEPRCVISWYDEEAAVAGAGAQGNLVNDVDLEVTVGATTYHGNYFSEDEDFDGSLLDIPDTFTCSIDTGTTCDPSDGVCTGGADATDGLACDGTNPGDPTCTGTCVFDDLSTCPSSAALGDQTCDFAFPAVTEDCNSNGSLDLSPFSLPVTGTSCDTGARDRNNSAEAVFIDPSTLSGGETISVSISNLSSVSVDVGLVCTGGIQSAAAPVRNSVRTDKGEYSCSDALQLSIVDGGADAGANLSGDVTVQSFDSGGGVIDTESGWSYTGGGAIASSQLVATIDAASGNNDQILTVEDGGSIVATYTDSGTPTPAATASAVVRCAPNLLPLGIARRGTNQAFGLQGGCDPRPRFDPRIIVFGLIPGTGANVHGDIFLDAGEDLVYQVAFTNQELGAALLDVTATLAACVASSGVNPDGTCVAASPDITILDPVQSLGTIQQGKTQLASFNVRVGAGASFPGDQILMSFGVSAERNGLTASFQQTFPHVLDVDTWSRPDEDPGVSGAFYYSSDFPTGGREIRVYAGEFFDPTNADLQAETFVFQDATTGAFGGGNASLGTYDATCTKESTTGSPTSCSATIANNWPWQFDLDNESFGTRRRFDSDTGLNTEMDNFNLWQYNATGECGFQSNDDSQTDGQGGTGGMWHTGFALTGAPGGRTGFDLGCEDYDIPGESNAKREQVLDTLSSPIFFRVHQNPDANGFEYTLEFLRLGFNLQYSMGDNNVIMASELDPDTTTSQPVDALDFGWLASDQGTDGFLEQTSQGPYQIFNPNDPEETTSCLVDGCVLDDTGGAGNNILKDHGAGSAGSWFDLNDPAKAPARSYGEIPGIFGTGRGLSLPARRGAGGFPVRNYDNGLNEVGAGSFEDTFGGNETRDPGQTYPINAGNPETLANRRDTFQINFPALVRESPNPAVPAVPSYGYGVDDVVAEWREQHPVADRTPCDDPSTWAVGADNDRCLTGPNVGDLCDVNNPSAACGLGQQCGPDGVRDPVGGPSADPSKASGCASISWDRSNILDPETALTLTVIDTNAQFGPDGTAGTGDEQAVDGLCGDVNGLVEVTSAVNAPGIDQTGEVFCLEQIAPVSSVYRTVVKVSSTTGLTSSTDGVIFVQENGDGSNPTSVVANFTDADINVNGTLGDNVPCPDNPRQATVNTQFVGGNILFVTAAVSDVGANADGDSIADDFETVELAITMVNNILDVNQVPADLEDVNITLVTNDPDVACILDGSSDYGTLLSGIAAVNSPADPFSFVVGNIGRTSTAQVLQAEFSLGISGRFTDSLGVERVVSSFATPQQFAINLDLDVSGAAVALQADSACIGGSNAGAACPGGAGDCPGGTCSAMPTYLQSGGASPIAGVVGYFEGFEGATAGPSSPGGGSFTGTSFSHAPAVFGSAPFGYLQDDVTGAGLSPGSTVNISGPDSPQGSSSVDGVRCQQHDPQGPQKAPRSESQCRPWEGSDWHVAGFKAFSGNNSLYAGTEGPDAGFPDHSFDGNHTNAHQAAFSGVMNVGVSGGATLSVQHIWQTTDDRTFNVPAGQAAGRGILEVAEVDPGTGDPITGWVKLNGFQNNYGNTAVQPFFVNCIFQSYDTFYDAVATLGLTNPTHVNATNVVGVAYNSDNVSSEDDYFDPNDPTRALGPSTDCFPQFSYSSLGDFTSTNVADKGKAFTAGQLGSNGNGVWINSLFNLDTFAGRTIRIRWVLSDIDIGVGLLWANIFGNALGNAFRGGIMDDVAVAGLVDAPLTLIVDNRALPASNDCPTDFSGTPGPDANCQTVTANAGPDIVSLVSGATVTLDAGGSLADRCVDGFLEYRWRSGGAILQNFSTNASLVVAPQTTTLYTVDVRCSTLPSCADLDTMVVLPADRAEASAIEGEFLDVAANGTITAYAPPSGSVGAPYDLYLYRVRIEDNGGVLRTTGGTLGAALSANLCDLNGGSPIATGVAAGASATFADTPNITNGEVVGYLSQAGTSLPSFGAMGQNDALGLGGINARNPETPGSAALGDVGSGSCPN